MKPVKQLTTSSCLQACIASLLELPIEEVPDFSAMHEDPNSPYPVWFIELQGFLGLRGFILVEIELRGQPWIPLPYETFAIFSGVTSKGSKHCIIGKCSDGDFIPVFDPLGEDNTPFNEVKTVSFLVATEPWKFPQRKETLDAVEKDCADIENKEVRNRIRNKVRAALGKPPYFPPRILGPDGRDAN